MACYENRKRHRWTYDLHTSHPSSWLTNAITGFRLHNEESVPASVIYVDTTNYRSTCFVSSILIENQIYFYEKFMKRKLILNSRVSMSSHVSIPKKDAMGVYCRAHNWLPVIQDAKVSIIHIHIKKFLQSSHSSIHSFREGKVPYITYITYIIMKQFVVNHLGISSQK